ncbi:MAG: flagellar basal body L-ring protein FlgH [candidate division Zixibacteria bacterium]|nr:flagellar basal body L-ring protein FlgH [candidate division Zixibacteria bacterium]
MKKILIIVFILVLLPFALKVKGEEYGQFQSLFTDIKAHKIGDVITVIISEQNRASNQVSSKSEKSTDVEAQGGPGSGPLDFIPLFGFDASNKNSFDGKGENSRNNSLRAKMTVTVTNIKPNGDLIIEGMRTLGISGDKETIVLTGVVRQKDISSDNTIESYQIADAEINFTGKGQSQSGSRPGLITRIFSWLF